MKTAEFNLGEFVQAYMVCALWSSTDDHGEPLDAVFSPDDISDETRADMLEDCKDFAESNAADLAEYCQHMGNEQWSGETRAGHDFWLTRNRHGSVFWDRGLGALGDRLADAARVYGSVDLYTGDDGWIYA